MVERLSLPFYDLLHTTPLQSRPPSLTSYFGKIGCPAPGPSPSPNTTTATTTAFPAECICTDINATVGQGNCCGVQICLGNMLSYNFESNIFVATDPDGNSTYYYSPAGLPTLPPTPHLFGACTNKTDGFAMVQTSTEGDACMGIALATPGNERWFYDHGVQRLTIMYTWDSPITTYLYIACDTGANYAYFNALGQLQENVYEFEMASMNVCLKYATACPSES